MGKHSAPFITFDNLMLEANRLGVEDARLHTIDPRDEDGEYWPLSGEYVDSRTPVSLERALVEAFGPEFTDPVLRAGLVWHMEQAIDQVCDMYEEAHASEIVCSFGPVGFDAI